MENQRQSMHGEWSSKWAFVLAATGAAVGLGNVWKFPYITGKNGGGAFVLVYLACVISIGVPLLMAEILLGRHGRQNPINTLRDIATDAKRSKHWQWLGAVSVLASFLILSYYSVIAGWSMDYIAKAATGTFHQVTAQYVDTLFKHLTASPNTMIFWHSLMMLLTIGIVMGGVEKGLERSVRFMFPIMLVLLITMVAYAAWLNHQAFVDAIYFLFHPDFKQLTSHGLLAALGHAFFTLSLATGSIMMYGAYLPQNASVTKAAVYITIADTLIALLAGLAIFPIVFATHLQPSAGPGLIFQTLPIAFSSMPYGSFFATLFFVMLFFAALTSAISLLEPSVAFLMERFNLKRKIAAFIAGFAIWLLGLATIFSFNDWQTVKLFGLNIFELLDYLTSNIMLPLGGLFIAVFTAWIMHEENILQELHLTKPNFLFHLWRYCLGLLTPLAIFAVFLKFIGVINF